MALTTHPNQLDSRRGLRAGLIGLAVLAFAAVVALGFSVVDYDSQPAPAAVDFPTVDEMRAENMEIRRQIAAAQADAAPSETGPPAPPADGAAGATPLVRPTKPMP